MKSDAATSSPITPSTSSAPESRDEWAAIALEHCRVLCEEIGPRPSAGEGERRAADYALQVLEDAIASSPEGPQVLEASARRELIGSQRSAYRPYSIALGAALLAHLLAGRSPSRRLLGAGASALAAWAFAREADLEPHWAHGLLAPGDSQNVVAILPARSGASGKTRRVVLCAHLDSHRTPVFYSSPAWLRAFSPVIALTFTSMLVDAARHALGRPRFSKIGLSHIALQSFSLALTLQAETSRHSHGANDNASGASAVLALAQRVAREPLENCEVWVALLGCEEVGAHGMRALLRRHSVALKDAHFLNFDMVGIGAPAALESEGLLRKVSCDPHLRAIAFQAAQNDLDLLAGSHVGPAYTDTFPALKQGFQALTIDSLIPNGHPAARLGGYWHQTEDTFDKIEPACLGNAVELGWRMLQLIDTE